MTPEQLAARRQAYRAFWREAIDDAYLADMDAAWTRYCDWPQLYREDGGEA